MLIFIREPFDYRDHRAVPAVTWIDVGYVEWRIQESTRSRVKNYNFFVIKCIFHIAVGCNQRGVYRRYIESFDCFFWKIDKNLPSICVFYQMTKKAVWWVFMVCHFSHGLPKVFSPCSKECGFTTANQKFKVFKTRQKERIWKGKQQIME